MPLEDAIVLMSRNFNNYLSSLRGGSEQPSMNFLLNLLADGRHLSMEELERIVKHLQDRRNRIAETQGITSLPSQQQQQQHQQQQIAAGPPATIIQTNPIAAAAANAGLLAFGD